MSTERYIELIHGEIDGMNTAEESAELQKILRSEGAAREFQEDMKRLTGALDRVDEVETPEGLRKAIRDRVTPRAAEPAAFKKPVLPAASGFRLAAALAAGLVLGLIIGPRIIQQDSGWNPAELGGSMLPGSGDRPAASVAIHNEILSGTISATESEGQVFVLFEFSAFDPLEFSLAYDRARLGFEGFSRFEGEFEAQTREGLFVVSGSGELGGTLLLSRSEAAATSLRLEYRRDGVLLGEETLDLAAE